MIWISDTGIEVDALLTFAMLYVSLIGWFTWRILRVLRSQRAAEMFLRERIARRAGLAARAQHHD